VKPLRSASAVDRAAPRRREVPWFLYHATARFVIPTPKRADVIQGVQVKRVTSAGEVSRVRVRTGPTGFRGVETVRVVARVPCSGLVGTQHDSSLVVTTHRTGASNHRSANRDANPHGHPRVRAFAQLGPVVREEARPSSARLAVLAKRGPVPRRVQQALEHAVRVFAGVALGAIFTRSEGSVG
jgi:hypothetical protein